MGKIVVTDGDLGVASSRESVVLDGQNVTIESVLPNIQYLVGYLANSNPLTVLPDQVTGATYAGRNDFFSDGPTRTLTVNRETGEATLNGYRFDDLPEGIKSAVIGIGDRVRNSDSIDEDQQENIRHFISEARDAYRGK